MAVANLGDVFPAIAGFIEDDVERVLGGSTDRPIEELPASVLTAEWVRDGRLGPPITARLVPMILDVEGLRAMHYTDLFPDLIRSRSTLAATEGVSPELVARLADDSTKRWQAFESSPAEIEARLGRSAALELTAAAIREAVAQARDLASVPERPRVTNVASALSVIADWAAGELDLTNVGSALAAAREDPHAPTEVRRALDVIDATPLDALTTGFEVTYDAFGAIRRLLDFDTRSRVVLERRIYGGKNKETLDQIGQMLNVTRERVRQIEVHLLKQIGLRLGSNDFDVVRRAAARLRDEIGDCRRISTLPDAAAWALDLRDAPSEERALHARFLLQLSGPWHEHEEWLLHDRRRTLPSESREILDSRLADGPIPQTEAHEILGQLGVPGDDQADWLAVVCQCRVIDGQVIRWRGSMADKAIAILVLRGEALTGDELAEAIGPDVNYRSMINQVQADERFMRRGLKLYGLRSWGGEEYTTIKDELEQEIERQGGSASLEHLIDALCTQFGVSEASVRAYASDAPFIRLPDGQVAVGEGEVRYARRAIEDCRGCFRIGSNWAWRVIVDREILRGSGRPLPAGVLQSIGMRPGDVRHMQTPAGEIMLRYGRQPTIGSLRRAALHLQCSEGDRLFVVLASGDQLDFIAVGAAALKGRTGADRLAAEAGDLDAHDPIAATAHALGLPPDEYRADAIRRRLRARREDELLVLLTDDQPAGTDDDLLDQLIGLGE